MDRVVETLRIHGVFVGIAFLYIAGAVATAYACDADDRLSLHLYSETLIVLIAFYCSIGIIAYGVYVLVWVHPPRPLQYSWNVLKTHVLTCERLLLGLPVVLILPLFMSVFSSLKVMIPVIRPFSWDATFDWLDVAIHAGHRPWELMQPVLGHPLVTSVVSFFYHLWFFVMFAVLLWQVFSLANLRLRMQYLITFQLSWMLLGTLLAIVFSSAGPCYYGRVVGAPDPYRPLMSYLWSAKDSYPLWALSVQEELWDGYMNKGTAPLGGISAMPSMHASSSFLFFLVAWRTHRRLGIVLGGIAAMICVGCVHLGWHYAVDAYIGIIGTWFLWWGVGRIQRAFAKRCASQQV